MLDTIDYKAGTVTYLDSLDYLKEDLLQVEYPDGYLLDVGWYGKDNGFFIYIVKDFDWEHPVHKISVESVDMLKPQIEEAVRLVMELAEETQ